MTRPGPTHPVPGVSDWLLRVLHLEDNPRDAALIRAALEGEGLHPEITLVSCSADFDAALDRGGFDLIFSDFALPDFDGLRALQRVLVKRPEVPFILISGTLGEEAAIDSLRSGATDYILKDRLSNLGPAVRRALTESFEKRTRRAAELALQATFSQLAASERRISKIFHGCPAAMGIGPMRDGRLTEANERLATLMGYEREEMIGRTVEELGLLADPGDRKRLLAKLHADGAVNEYQCRLRRKSGEVFDALMSLQMLDLEGEPQLLVMPYDITERRRSERHRAIQYGVTRLLAESDSLDEAAPHLVEVMGENLGWDACALWLQNSGGDTLRCAALWLKPGLEAEAFAHQTRGLELRVDEGLAGRVWLSGAPVWIENSSADVALPRADALRQAGLRGACAFPIRSGDRLNGTFEFFCRARSTPDEAVISLMTDLGQQIGQFHGRRQAEEALLERSRLATLSAKVAVVLTQEGTPAEMLQNCAETLVRDLRAGCVRIWTLPPGARVLESLAAAGSDPAAPGAPRTDEASARVEIGSTSIGRIAERRSPYWTNDVLHDPQLAEGDWARQESMTSFVGHPLMVEGRLLGVIAICAGARLGESTIEAIGAVADAIALGLERKLTAEARRKLEAQFLQSQKMEAVGRLAGGIAHDFNNLLTAILGFGNLALAGVREGDPLYGKLQQIVRAGERAGALTRQLLAFSRKQMLEPQVLDLNVLVRDVEKMLRRMIGEDVQLATSLAPNLGRVLADPGQVEQVLMNLVINSRDAMPGGGQISIETYEVLGSAEAQAEDPPLAPGNYVAIAVRDNGTGMSEQTRSRIFEPFFTTKESGKGTGLGLATVYGIVQQSGGHISVDSALGRGTCVRIYLSRTEQDAALAFPSGSSAAAQGGNETVLVVEDEEGVRDLTCTVLAAQGYRILTAATAEAALEIARSTRDPLHLVLTDVVLPGMNGPALVRALTALNPASRVLFMTGYTDDAVLRHGLGLSGVTILRKPFTPGELARKVRDVLDEGTADGQGSESRAA